MRYIHFIVNPISGNGKHTIGITELERYFPKESFRIVVEYSNYKKHAVALAKKAIAQNPECIVACGGDGTINEVASCLVGTKIKLGIIPVGSGNGLAANLSIPKDMGKAAEIIREGSSTAIDVGKVNEHYFFSNMGIGIDAMVIKKYEAGKNRTLFAYVKATLLSLLEYKTIKAVVSFNKQIIHTRFFLLFVSNSNEMGYGMSLTPKASLTDGWLDLVIAPKLGFIEKLRLGIAILKDKVQQFEKAQHSLVKKIDIEMPEKIYPDLQIDGEYHNLKTNRIEVEIITNGLEVLVN